MQRMIKIHISLDAEDVLEGHGIDPGRVHSGIVDSAQEILAEPPDLLDPAAVYDIFPITHPPDSLSSERNDNDH